ARPGQTLGQNGVAAGPGLSAIVVGEPPTILDDGPSSRLASSRSPACELCRTLSVVAWAVILLTYTTGATLDTGFLSWARALAPNNAKISETAATEPTLP